MKRIKIDQVSLIISGSWRNLFEWNNVLTVRFKELSQFTSFPCELTFDGGVPELSYIPVITRVILTAPNGAGLFCFSAHDQMHYGFLPVLFVLYVHSLSSQDENISLDAQPVLLPGALSSDWIQTLN